MNQPLYRIAILVTITHVLGFTLANVRADDFTWNNNDTNITWDHVNNNWIGGGVLATTLPGSANNVFFDTDLLGLNVPTEAHLNGDRHVQKAHFLGEDAFTLSGDPGHTLTLDSGDLTANLSADPNAYTISVDLLLLDEGMWQIDAVLPAAQL